MKIKSEILFIILMFWAYSCSPKGDGTVSEVSVNGHKMYVFSLDELKSGIVTVPLSSLVESCDLIQLENHKDALINTRFTTVTEKYIGVIQSMDSYKLFDRSGKFLGKVGAIGRGPGEYFISIYDDIIDDKNELIYLAPLSSDRILVYSISGKFIKEIVSPQWLAKPKMFLSNNILTVVQMAMDSPYNPEMNSNRAMVIQFDINNGKVLREFAPPEHLVVQSYDGEIFNTRNMPLVFDFSHTSSDTLYHFDVTNNRILPVFLMRYHSTEESWKNYIQLNKNLFMTGVYFLETNPETRRLGYVYKGLVATDLKTKTSSWVDVVNDFYGNMSVQVSNASFRNGYFVHNIEPELLKAKMEARLAEKNCTEKDRETLKKIVSTLDENANNVVFIGKLRPTQN